MKHGKWCLVIVLLHNFNCLAQNIFPAIEKQFNEYNNNNYQEKVFLHTDKTAYATGEILWFKAYVTDAASNKFSMLSKICYVEIIGADKKTLMQGKMNIDSGQGNGSFLLPSSIRTGSYYIRAYTNWMKNFGPQFYFEENISIINPNRKEELAIADSALPDHLQLLPEGGNLVFGLDNNIAFQFTNPYSKGLQGDGFIIDQKNDTIVRFKTERFGMGAFSFRPVKGNIYHAIIKSGKKSIVKELPEIYDHGWVLHLADEGNTLKINVACNISREQNLFLFVQSRDSVKLARMESLNNGNAVFAINKSDLAEGISQLTVFNAEKQPVCERLYFKRPSNTFQIKLDDIQQQYEPRKKVEINLASMDTNGIAVNANLSMAVYLVDSLQPDQKINVLNYLWLTSELKGDIESPGYYFENSGAEVAKATDNLMLTQGWRRFKWEKVLNNKKPSFSFLPEYEGHIITGKISPKIANLKDDGVNVYLSVPGKNFKFSNSTSTAGGLVKFNIEKFYGSRELVVQTNALDSNYRIVMDNPFSDEYNEKALEPLHLVPTLANNILLRSVSAQSFNIFNPGMENNFNLPVTYDTTAFFGLPFKQYNLDAYTRFPTMEEVIREFVKEVHLKKREKYYHFEVFNEPYLTYFDNDPLVLIDGVPVFNFNKIVDIDPLKIQKIDVVATKFFKGNQAYDGIVSYATYNGDLDSYQLDPNALVVEYDGLQLHREFYSPQYDSDKQLLSRNPDYRNVLYWSPDVATKSSKKNISFYTSDIAGKYMVIAQGISDSGKVSVTTASFIVSPK